MIINRENQISITIFVATISALAPGYSNFPFAVIPCLFFVTLKIINNLRFSDESSIFLLPKSSLYISWIIYFVIFALLSLINVFSLSIFNSAYESFLFAIIYLLYITFFCQFNFIELINGIIKGVIPMFSYILFIELPLRLIFPEILINLREFLNLRNTNEFVLRGFFEESSQMPSLILVLISVLSFFIISKYKTSNLSKNDFLIFFILFVSFISISGSLIVCFYLPLIIFLFFKFVFRLFNGKLLLMGKFNTLMLTLFSMLFISYGRVIMTKLNSALSFQHSAAVRSLGFLGSFYDIISNPIMGVGAGLYRTTRESSVLGFINFFPSGGEVHQLLLGGYQVGGYESFVGVLFPVYSALGYLLSESGLFFLLFIVPYIHLIYRGLKLSWSKFNKFNLLNIDILFLGLMPLSYIFYFTIGYPRMLPYFVLAIILFEKYINETESARSSKLNLLKK